MPNYECPNCGQFKYKKQMSVRGCGWRLLLIVPIISLLIPGGSRYHGGNMSFNDVGGIAFWSIVIGIFIIIISYISPQKKIQYKCDNCEFEQEHEI